MNILLEDQNNKEIISLCYKFYMSSDFDKTDYEDIKIESDEEDVFRNYFDEIESDNKLKEYKSEIKEVLKEYEISDEFFEDIEPVDNNSYKEHELEFRVYFNKKVLNTNHFQDFKEEGLKDFLKELIPLTDVEVNVQYYNGYGDSYDPDDLYYDMNDVSTSDTDIYVNFYINKIEIKG